MVKLSQAEELDKHLVSIIIYYNLATSTSIPVYAIYYYYYVLECCLKANKKL